MKTITLLLTLVMSLESFAQQRIGSGGGDAEIVVLSMIPFLKTWNKMCQENPSACWGNQKNEQNTNSALERAFEGFPLSAVTFSDMNSSTPQCSDGVLNINRSDLYQDSFTSKSKPQIAAELINSVLECRGHALHMISSIPRVLPVGKFLSDTDLVVFQDGKNSILVSIFDYKNANIILSDEIQCTQFHVLSSFNRELSVKCLDNNVLFKVHVLQNNPLKVFSVVDYMN
jgi:hypothetical protein